MGTIIIIILTRFDYRKSNTYMCIQHIPIAVTLIHYMRIGTPKEYIINRDL